MIYDGWELHNFDKANIYRKYQFSLIKKSIKGNILEVGPGNCVYLENYLKIASSITLVETTKKYFNLLKKRSKRIILKKNLNSLKKKTFDTILYLDVLEHIKNDHLELKKAYGLLKKGGILIICVPAFQFLYSSFDKKIGHYRRYDKSSFLKLLNKCNIKNHKMRYFDFIGACFIFLSNIFLKESLGNFSLKIKLWNFLIPVSFLFDFFLFKFFFGKSLLVKITKN